MALHPYDGMTLDLPTEDGVWASIYEKEDIANLCMAAYHLGNGTVVKNIPSWAPMAYGKWDWTYGLSYNGGSSFTEYSWDEKSDGSMLGMLNICLRAVDSIVNYTAYYQGFGLTHMETSYGYSTRFYRVIQSYANPQPTLPAILCSNLLCKKMGDYYWLTYDKSEIIRLHWRAFFWDDGIPEPKLTYRVYANWTYQEDPNTGGGESSTGGGDGGHDDHSDTINIPGLPSISAAQAGLITLFKPELSELRSLNNYLWTNWNDFIENLQKFFSNPIDYIIALNILPVTPNTGSSRKVKLGLWETSVSMAPVSSQWYEFDCGTLTLPKYWGSALDYAPYTKIGCMLPFIGYVDLNTDEIMGKVLQIKYHIDLLSGSCVALITVNGSIYYQFTGECAVNIPITGDNWSRVYSAAIGAIGVAAGGLAAAGASGAITQAGFQSSNMLAAKNGLQAAKGFQAAHDALKKGTHGRPALLQASKDARNTAIAAASGGGNVGRAITASRAISALNNSAGQVMGGKVGVSHSGSIGGTAGLLGVRRPFLIIEYPNQSLAENYKHYMGYPSNITATCENLSGYTEFEQILLEGIPGTDEELAELNEALKGGVYF